MEKLSGFLVFFCFFSFLSFSSSVYARELENKGLKTSRGLWCPLACPTPGYSFLLSIQQDIIFPSKEICKVSVLSWFCEKLSGKGSAICD